MNIYKELGPAAASYLEALRFVALLLLAIVVVVGLMLWLHDRHERHQEGVFLQSLDTAPTPVIGDSRTPLTR